VAVPVVQAVAAPRPHPLFERLAPQIIEDVGPAGFKEWLRTDAPATGWRNNRNQKECATLAEALDALVLSKDVELAKEILARRFVGVWNADKSGNWNVAEVLAQSMPRRTLLRPSVISAVLREAKNLSLLEAGGLRIGARSGSGASSGSSSSTRATGNGNRGRGSRSRSSTGRNSATSTGAHQADSSSDSAAHSDRAGGGGNGR
jgi:hypothetical protein